MKKLGLHDILETQRCIIKIPEESDAQEMMDLGSSRVTQYLTWNKLESLDEQKQHVQKRRTGVKEGVSWHACIFLKDTKEQIGSISFQNIREDIQSSEIGYWLGEDYWEKGYISECLEKIIQVAFSQLDWESLIIRTDVPNVNSRKVAEKAGFTLDGILRKNSLTQGEIVDVTHYSLTKEDYLYQK